MLVTWLPARSEPPPENNHQPRLDRYGDPLPRGAIARYGTVRLREPALALSFSPDGKTLASANYGRISFWDTKTGKLLRRSLSFDPKAVPSQAPLAFSPDGKIFAIELANPGNFRISLFETATGTLLRSLGISTNISPQSASHAMARPSLQPGWIRL
jgi:WD40 repeat protein